MASGGFAIDVARFFVGIPRESVAEAKPIAEGVVEDTRPIAKLKVGDTANLVHVVAERDLTDFARATGDVNPIHFDQQYAESTFFKGRIAHGMLSAGFISAVIAGKLPGLGTVYVSQNLRFLAPVKIGDAVTAEVEVLELDLERNRVRLRTTCKTQDGTVVLDGEAVVMPPKKAVVYTAPQAGNHLSQDETLGGQLGEERAAAAALDESWRLWLSDEPGVVALREAV